MATISASFAVTSALNWSESPVFDTEMTSITMMSSTVTGGDLNSGPVMVTPTPALSEYLVTATSSAPTLSDIQVESSPFTSPSYSYFALDVTPSVNETGKWDSSSLLYFTYSSSQSVYPSTISHTPAVTTIASSSVFPGDTSRTNATVSSLPSSHLTPTPYVPPVTSTTITTPSLSSTSPVIRSITPGTSTSTTTMNSTGNGTIIGHPPPQATSIPLALVIALPVCIGVLLILAVAALLYIIHRRRRQKAGIETKRTESDKELWLNTGTQLPPLPPSPVSLGNGHIVPLTPTETELQPVKDHIEGVTHYEVIHEFEARLEAQLTLTMGQKVTVEEKADNGWWRGWQGDKTGWFPGEYVKAIDAGGTANGQKSKFNQLDQSLGVEETDVSFISHPIKPGVSSFLIRKKGQEDKSPADLVKESKQVKHTDTDQNGNGVIPNSNMGSAHTQPDENMMNMTNELNVLKSPEQGSSSESLLVYSSSGVLSRGQRYSAIYPYTAGREGEITLQENDVVVYLEEGSIGWIRGRKESTDEEGWVPASYLQQVIADRTHSQLSLAEACYQIQDQLHTNKRLSLATEHFVGIEHRAMYGYAAQHPGDLSFEAGDIIIVLDALENGWWHGLKGEEFGWFPGSFVEILEGDRDSPPVMGTESLSSSQNSSYADLLKNMNEELTSRNESDTLSMGSISTAGSDEGKPKPVRKAPAPPSSKDSIKQSSRKKRLIRRPSRPAPPPPAPPTLVAKGDNTPTESEPVNAPAIVVNGNGEANFSDKGETTQKKPPLPRRFVKPKLVKISKKRLKLQNSAALPVAPSRPVPPRPPAPRASSVKKFATKSSKKDKSLDSRSSLSGNKLKKSDISSPMVLEHTTIKTDNMIAQPVISGQTGTGSGSNPRADAVLHDNISTGMVEDSSPGRTDKKNPIRERLSSPGPPVAPKPKYHMSSIEDRKSPDKNNLLLEVSPTSGTADNGHHGASLVSDSSHDTVRSESEDSHKHDRQSNSSAINAVPENIAIVPVPKPRRRNSSENELDSPEAGHDTNYLNPSQSKENSSGTEENKHKHVKQPRPPPPKTPPPPTKTSSMDEVEIRPPQKKKSLKKTIDAYKSEREGELSFEEGSFIKEMDEVSDRPGWFVGMLADGTIGTFHQSHVDDTTINRQSTA